MLLGGAAWLPEKLGTRCAMSSVHAVSPAAISEKIDITQKPTFAARRGAPCYKPEPVGVLVRMRRLRESDADVSAPRYMSAGAAGMDLCAAVTQGVALGPGARAMIPIGYAIEIPAGFEGQVRPRSGLAAKHGVTVVNAPGTLDSDFRGEVQVLLVNHGGESFVIERNMRIAQLVIAPVVQAELEIVDALSETARGANGFGSSGS